METAIRHRRPVIQWVLLGILFAALLGLLGYQLFGQLDQMFITDYDEARHGVNAYEMIRNDDYLVSTYQGETDLWNLKPPLSFWLIALSYRLFGYNAFALRFFSALAALLTAGSLTFWVSRRYGVWAALFTLLCFTGNPRMFGLHFARYGDADAQYQLFFTLAMLCMMIGLKSFRWFYGSGIFFGLAFLEKGTHAFVIPVVCLAALLAAGQIRKLSAKRVLLLLASGLALTAPWAIARYLRDGTLFFSKMFATDVVNRLGTTADTVGTDWPAAVYYLWTIITNPMQVVCLAVIALSGVALLLRREKLPREQRDVIWGAVLWLTVPFLLYSAANVKYVWYLYSSMMAFPVVAIALLIPAMRTAGKRWLLRTGGLLTAAALTLFSVQNTLEIAQMSFHHVIQGFLRENLDRELDAGMHAYIVYNENKRSEWMPADMLTALCAGDVQCVNGGEEAFLADEDSAILFVCKENNNEDVQALMEYEPVRNEDYYMVAFVNE